MTQNLGIKMLDEAIHLKGSQTALAAEMTAVSAIRTVKNPYGQSHISTWKRRGKIPAEACPDLEKATGIARFRFRPDIYPPAVVINDKQSVSRDCQKTPSEKTAKDFNNDDGRQQCGTS